MIALFGILLTTALVVAAALMNGAPSSFVNVGGLMIVVLGTITVTLAGFHRREILRFPSALASVLFSKRIDPSLAANSVIQLAQKARRDGALSLQTVLPTLAPEPYLQRAVAMVVDGMSPPDIEAVLKLEDQRGHGDEQLVRDVMQRAGHTAPAMGLIGTLIGLVQMLGQLNDPKTLGPAIAVALLTTFYGALLAYVVLLPIAGLAQRQEMIGEKLNAIYAAGATSMARRENPKTLQLSLEAIVPENAGAPQQQAKAGNPVKKKAA
ncbi:MAG: MotA/TolQ/ExbB proton channel family protein [Pseudomonadota bacterium]